jgi:hypothetical protein
VFSIETRPTPLLKLKLGFPEFESFHLANFSAKAQFSKSVASTIPPRPRDCPNLLGSNADSIAPSTVRDCNSLSLQGRNRLFSARFYLGMCANVTTAEAIAQQHT